MNWAEIVLGGAFGGVVVVVFARFWAWVRRELLIADGFDPKNPRNVKASHAVRQDAP